MSQSFVWNIDPIIFHIYGPFAIRWYSLFFLCGFLVGHAAFAGFLRDAGKPVELRESLLYYVVFGTIIGARLGHCLFYDPIYFLTNPLKILQTWEGGLASHGGYLGVMIALVLFSRKNKETPFFWLADRVAVVALLAGALIRLGNLFNSEILGTPTDLPWAVIFSRIDQIPRHPAQVYESLTYALVSLGLYGVYRLSNRKPLEGRLFGMVLVAGFVSRFVLEIFKENQEAFEDGMIFNMGQVLNIPFILLGICFVLGWHHKWPFLAWAFSQDKSNIAPPKSTKRRRGSRKHQTQARPNS